MAENLLRLSVNQKIKLRDEFRANYSANVIIQNQCHLWTKDQSKYPKYWVEPLKMQICVHTVVYFLFRSRIPRCEGDELSHLCGRERCVNIDHLTIDPHDINIERKKCHGTGLKKGEAKPSKCQGHTKQSDVYPRKTCIL